MRINIQCLTFYGIESSIHGREHDTWKAVHELFLDEVEHVMAWLAIQDDSATLRNMARYMVAECVWGVYAPTWLLSIDTVEQHYALVTCYLTHARTPAFGLDRVHAVTRIESIVRNSLF